MSSVGTEVRDMTDGNDGGEGMGAALNTFKPRRRLSPPMRTARSHARCCRQECGRVMAAYWM